MRREIALAGFVMTEDEWYLLDEAARAQLVAVLSRRDAWIPDAPPGVGMAVVDDEAPYALYEIVWARA